MKSTWAVSIVALALVAATAASAQIVQVEVTGGRIAGTVGSDCAADLLTAQMRSAKPLSSAADGPSARQGAVVTQPAACPAPCRCRATR